jgi:hypothetical protein
MYYSDQYISFNLANNFTIKADYDVLRWIIIAKNNNLPCLGVRIISSDRAPYTLKYIHQFGKPLKDSFSQFILPLPSQYHVIKEIPGMLNDNASAIYYTALFPLGELSARITAIIHTESDFVKFLDFLQSMEIQSHNVIPIIEIIKRETMPIVDEYVAFFGGVLHWTKEYTLVMLENMHRHLRDDIEDRNSPFYHENSLYWAVMIFLRTISKYGDFWMHEPDLNSIIQEIVYPKKETCIGYTSDEWKKIRMAIDAELHLQNSVLEQFNGLEKSM